MLSKFIITLTYIHPSFVSQFLQKTSLTMCLPVSYRTTKNVNIKLHQIFQEKRKVTYISTHQLCTLTFT